MPRAEADDHDRQVVEVAQEASTRGSSASRSCAWPTLPECMTTNVPASPFARAQSLSRGCGVIARVSTQFGITLMPVAAARPSPRAARASSRRSRRPGRRGAGRSRRAARRTPTTQRVLEPPELDRDLREDVLADDDERRPKRRATSSADVADHRRVGHAEDDVRPLRARPDAQRAAEVA